MLTILKKTNDNPGFNGIDGNIHAVIIHVKAINPPVNCLNHPIINAKQTPNGNTIRLQPVGQFSGGGPSGHSELIRQGRAKITKSIYNKLRTLVSHLNNLGFVIRISLSFFIAHIT